MNSVRVQIGEESRIALAKTFSTGSRGFYLGDKLVIDGKRYQVSLSIVEIGSKPSGKRK